MENAQNQPQTEQASPAITIVDALSAQLSQGPTILSPFFEFQNLDGTPYGYKDRTLTMFDVIETCLLGTFPQEQQSAVVKMERWLFYKQVRQLHQSGDKKQGIVLHVTSAINLFNLIGYAWPPLVVGSVYEAMLVGQKQLADLAEQAQQATHVRPSNGSEEQQQSAALDAPRETAQGGGEEAQQGNSAP